MTRLDFASWLKTARAGETIQYHVSQRYRTLRFNRKPEDDCACADAALEAAGYSKVGCAYGDPVWAKNGPARVHLTQRRGEKGRVHYLATRAAACLALLLLTGCGGLWYDPVRDPTHLERCDRGEVVEFCG